MKTIKLSLEETTQANAALSILLSNNEFPFEKAWELEDMLEAVQKHSKRYDKARTVILNKYGKPRKENNQLYTISDMPKFNKEIEVLNETEVTIEIEPLMYEDLKAIEGLKIAPASLQVLKKYFITREGKVKTNEDNK